MTHSSTAPVVVIVPVRNRRDLLARTLEALDRQDFRDFEVVVVDDGSTDGSGELAAGSVVAGRPVRVLQGGGHGAVAARSLAIAETAAPLLAFTDSDCEPAPTWLGAAVSRLKAGASLAHGPTRPTRAVLPLERSVNEADGGLFPSCNLAVSREAYEAVGGFDRDAGGRLGFQTSHRARGLGFGEDTIFGWRVARRFEVAYDDRMLVHHVVLPADLRDWLGRSWQMAAFPALVREVPELQSTGLVRRGFLFSHRSRTPVYVFALTLLTRRPGLIAAAALWWAAHRFQATLRRQPLSITDRARALPAQLVLDAVQAAALAAGSVRARKLLL